jgi:hypothetical protein
MPRGQDAPLRTGGEVSPYVTSSMQQNKALAENRLVAAMQEAGATERTRTTEQGAAARTAMQVQAQRNMQAADIAAQDRRAAEAEAARREDRQFTETMQESTQAFQAEQAKLERDYQDAVRNKEWDRADKIFEQVEAARRFDFEMELDASERTTNAILSMTKLGLQQQAAREKAITTLADSEQKFEQDKEIYDTTVNRTIDGFSSDKRMDLPIPGSITPPTPPSKLKTIGMAAIGMTPEGYIKEAGAYAEKIREAKYADPIGVMQSQINQTGASISVEELSSRGVSGLEDRLANNKIQAQDIRNVAAVVEGTLEALNDRISKASADKEISFWKSKKAEVIEMRSSLENLRRSQRKIETNGNETVGTRVRTALGVKGASLGGRVSMIKKTLGTSDYGEVLADLTKSLTLPALKDVTETMTPYERQLRENYNAIILRKYPDLGGK